MFAYLASWFRFVAMPATSRRTLNSSAIAAFRSVLVSTCALFADSCSSRGTVRGNVLKINQLDTITDDVIEAAASILVIGN